MNFTYKGLKAVHNKHAVTEEEVLHQLQRLQQQNPRIAPITDRPTQLGDEVVLSYAGYCGGEQFAGGTAENQTLILGSGMFIPGFEEQLVDKVCEEEVTVQVTFPEQYHSEALAGKAAEFLCRIHEIRVKTPYELDDTFAKEVGGCDSLDEMKVRMQESLQAYSDERGEMDLQDRLLRMAAATLDMQIDPKELEAAVDQQMQTLSLQLQQQGLSLQMYCSFMQTDEQTLRKDACPAAENALRSQAAIDRIVELEKLQATQEEIGQALAMIARQNNITLEQLKEVYDAQLEQAVISSVLATKVMRLIRDAAVIEAV